MGTITTTTTTSSITSLPQSQPKELYRALPRERVVSGEAPLNSSVDSSRFSSPSSRSNLKKDSPKVQAKLGGPRPVRLVPLNTLGAEARSRTTTTATGTSQPKTGRQTLEKRTTSKANTPQPKTGRQTLEKRTTSKANTPQSNKTALKVATVALATISLLALAACVLSHPLGLATALGFISQNSLLAITGTVAGVGLLGTAYLSRKLLRPAEVSNDSLRETWHQNRVEEALAASRGEN